MTLGRRSIGTLGRYHLLPDPRKLPLAFIDDFVDGIGKLIGFLVGLSEQIPNWEMSKTPQGKMYVQYQNLYHQVEIWSTAAVPIDVMCNLFMYICILPSYLLPFWNIPLKSLITIQS